MSLNRVRVVDVDPDRVVTGGLDGAVHGTASYGTLGDHRSGLNGGGGHSGESSKANERGSGEHVENEEENVRFVSAALD